MGTSPSHPVSMMLVQKINFRYVKVLLIFCCGIRPEPAHVWGRLRQCIRWWKWRRCLDFARKRWEWDGSTASCPVRESQGSVPSWTSAGLGPVKFSDGISWSLSCTTVYNKQQSHKASFWDLAQRHDKSYPFSLNTVWSFNGHPLLVFRLTKK